jgi:hypothetical protein
MRTRGGLQFVRRIVYVVLVPWLTDISIHDSRLRELHKDRGDDQIQPHCWAYVQGRCYQPNCQLLHPDDTQSCKRVFNFLTIQWEELNIHCRHEVHSVSFMGPLPLSTLLPFQTRRPCLFDA